MRVENQLFQPQTLQQLLREARIRDEQRTPAAAQQRQPTPQERVNQEVKALMEKSRLHVSSGRVDAWA